ncbi:hypothetical protein [Dietzia alimentaria]|uniref:hypothetical protein n=1 Tax=Dietzia alimentaria TaxID=665550 RepID=UPI00029AB668|nr:hypothetical protein [Dietzia alimentaria]
MATHHRWALAAVAVTGVTVLSVQQTGALWSDSAQQPGATISSGRLDVAVGTSGTKVADYEFEALTGTDMVSGEFVQRPLHVHNTGSVRMQYRLQSVTLSVPSEQLPLYLEVTQVSSEAGCPASGDASGVPIYDDELHGAQTADRTLAAGASEILCFRATMGQNPTAGASGTATFTFQATQS